jgi:hypothetical protein
VTPTSDGRHRDAPSPEAIRKTAERNELPVDRITRSASWTSTSTHVRVV